jgi:hypothetical protein
MRVGRLQRHSGGGYGGATSLRFRGIQRLGLLIRAHE